MPCLHGLDENLEPCTAPSVLRERRDPKRDNTIRIYKQNQVCLSVSSKSRFCSPHLVRVLLGLPTNTTYRKRGGPESKRSAPLNLPPTSCGSAYTQACETEPRLSGARLVPPHARCLLTCETDTSRPSQRGALTVQCCPYKTESITMPLCRLAPSPNPPRAKWAHDDHRGNLLRGGTPPTLEAIIA